MKLPKQKGVQPQFRPIAEAIQIAMKQRGMGVPELTEALGFQVSQRGAVANWVVGKNGVSAQYRPKVAQVLGLREDQLTITVDTLGRRRSGPAQRAVALVEKVKAAAKANGELVVLPAAAMPISDVFTIRVRSDGSMTLKLDATLPFAKGIQLAQHLLTFGLVAGSEAE